jgi:hypothetical protein
MLEYVGEHKLKHETPGAGPGGKFGLFPCLHERAIDMPVYGVVRGDMPDSNHDNWV